MEDAFGRIAAISAQYPWIATTFWLATLAAAAAFVNFVVKVALVRILNRVISGLGVFQSPAGRDFAKLAPPPAA